MIAPKRAYTLTAIRNKPDVQALRSISVVNIQPTRGLHQPSDVYTPARLIHGLVSGYSRSQFLEA